jgi:hypothetical protein
MVCLLRHRLKRSIDSLADRPLDPGWFGLKGVVQHQDDQRWITNGIYAFDDVKMTVTIKVLPVGTLTKNYKAFLDVLHDA